ncbi:hypothetical protein [Sphingobacterium mizutaii]|uniref:hypothetical protein n=1 Tax=Sphingobacterium mizutaii TaxID=1010 RepID=UPI003D967D4F
MYCSETLRACHQGDTKKVIENYFTHAVGYPSSDPIFYKDVTPTGGFFQTKNSSFRRMSYNLHPPR